MDIITWIRGYFGILVFTIILIFLAYLWVISRRPKFFPPGPPSVPLFGSIPFLQHGGAEYYKEFSRLSRKHGDIFSIALGHTWVIVLNGYDVIKEALVTNGADFAGRIQDPRQDVMHKNPDFTQGIVDGDYTPEWIRQRNTSINIMRSLGWGKNSIEQRITKERDVLVEIIKECKGEPFNPAKAITTTVVNIICSLLFGESFQQGDQRLQNMIKSIEITGSTYSLSFEWDDVPYLSNFIPGTTKLRDTIHQAVISRQDLVQAEIDIRKERLAKDSELEPMDFIESYLKELSASDECKKSKITEDWLLEVALDFFVAGSGTTATTLKWGLIYMMHNPEVAEKVQEEIDTVIGPPTGRGSIQLSDRDRLPYTDAAIMEIQRFSSIAATALVHCTTKNEEIDTVIGPPTGRGSIQLSDRDRLPYTDAAIMEIQRFSSIAATALVHCTTKNVSIRGYHLPKGTQVRYNIHAVHYDPSYWSQPEAFIPERFLDEEGKIRKDEHWIPFGIGRRNCLGEQLAKQELFIFFTGIMHNFNIHLPDGATLPSLEPAVAGIGLLPAEYQVVFEPRF